MATTRKKAGTKKAGTMKAGTTTATRPRAGSKSKVTGSSAAKSAAKAAAKAAPKVEVPKSRPTRTKSKVSDDTSTRVALAVAEAALDKKALNVEIIDVQGKVDYADYVVVMSGSSDRQVSALARGIAEDVEKNTKTKCLGVEGLPGGAWVLMDFGDIVVHIFHHDVRGYYDLESLWIDAARLPVPGSASR
ncbi:MAG: ribosome silencing factor [Myxococcota bacterium]|nr:ribosome silencing factor [Myxococcota bacterium]